MKKRKLVSTLCVFAFVLQIVTAIVPFSVHAALVTESENKSREIKVKGNKVVYANDESVEVVLRGVNIESSYDHPTMMDVDNVWGAKGEPGQLKYILNTLDCNFIRITVSVPAWLGVWGQGTDNPWTTDPDGSKYRNKIDDVINEISKAGKYAILDMHAYDIFNKQSHLEFWDTAAIRYKNNPTVLFGIMNEPTVGWDEWLKGDSSAPTQKDLADKKFVDLPSGRVRSVGHQFMVERIRETGAKNIIIAGGPGYSGTLERIGTDQGYDLIDQGIGGDKSKQGNGIMYDFHRYPLHGTSNPTDHWHNRAGAARLRYPILMGEFGWQAGLLDYTPPKGSPSDHPNWFPSLFNWMNDYERYGNYANWTAFVFHPSSGPPMLVNKSQWYTDIELNTVFGTYIRDELARVRETDNVSKGKTPTDSGTAPTSLAKNATDSNRATTWVSSNMSGDKWLEIDLGAVYDINRWYVRHSETASQITSDFKLQYKLNSGDSWKDADSLSGTVTNNTWAVTDNFIKTTTARYVRLYITKPAQSGYVARISEFAVMKKVTPVYKKTVPYYHLYNPYGQIVKNEFLPAKGNKMTAWNGKTPTYVENNTIMRLNGNYGFEHLGASVVFGDLRDVDFFRFTMKSTAPMDVQLQAVYRIPDPDETKSSNWVTLPSTGGEWKDVILTPEELGYSEISNTWLRTEHARYITINSVSNYNPYIKLNINTNDETVDITRITSQYNGTASIAGIDFVNNDIEDNNGLKSGKTDVVMTLNNPENNALDGALIVASMYDKVTGVLVDVSIKEFDLQSGIYKHTFTLNMPAEGNPDDYFVKVLLLKDRDSYETYSNPIEFHSNGMIVSK